MQGQQQVIDALNSALSIKLITINQYFLHARMLKNWGLSGLGQMAYGFSLTEMKHADRLIERILFLDAIPVVSDTGYLHIGENAEEILRSGLRECTRSTHSIASNIATCENQSDYVSRDLLSEILEDMESQIDCLETQISLLESLGMQKFLQSHID